MRYSFIIFILIFAVSPHIGSGPPPRHPLKFGFNPSNSPPLLYQFENDGMPMATGGLIFEMSVAIAEDLADDYVLVRTPRQRISEQLNSNKLDLICHNSESWGHAFSDEVVWSKPLFNYSNVLVAKKEIPYAWPDQIPNARIGTVENYRYVDLESQFKNQTLERVDAPSVLVNLRKLLADRLDYVVMSEIEFNFHRATNPQLQRSTFVIGKTDIRCSLSKKSTLTLQRLNKTIDQLTRKRVFQKIYAKYLDPKTIPEPFSYGLNGEHSPPFLILDSETPLIVKGGLFFDIGLEVAKQIKRPITYVLLPRGRLDSRLAEGQIVLVCYNTEVWAGEYAKQYDWSIPIYQQSNYIVGLRGSKTDPPIQAITELKGKRVGTTLNFVYPAMTAYFENGGVIREDAGSGSANVEKLLMMRVPYILLNSLEYNYHKKLNPRIERSPIEIDPVEVKCAVSKKSDLKIQKINDAILELKKTGRMQKIFMTR